MAIDALRSRPSNGLQMSSRLQFVLVHGGRSAQHLSPLDVTCWQFGVRAAAQFVGDVGGV